MVGAGTRWGWCGRWVGVLSFCGAHPCHTETKLRVEVNARARRARSKHKEPGETPSTGLWVFFVFGYINFRFFYFRVSENYKPSDQSRAVGQEGASTHEHEKWWFQVRGRVFYTQGGGTPPLEV